ncbi:MAG: hypothetical protein JO056_12990 [Alphaproteobacteria bacterium]|nr:hypothetical protein [Alphaproteobacteria bacterium]
MNRRTIVAGSAAGLAIVAAGAIALRPDRLLRKRYPPTPYDDLLGLLTDRELARQIGRVYLSGHANFTSATAAGALRKHIAHRPLEIVLTDEVASGQLVEAAHWIMPETLVGLCALAARS